MKLPINRIICFALVLLMTACSESETDRAAIQKARAEKKERDTEKRIATARLLIQPEQTKLELLSAKYDIEQGIMRDLLEVFIANHHPLGLVLKYEPDARPDHVPIHSTVTESLGYIEAVHGIPLAIIASAIIDYETWQGEYISFSQIMQTFGDGVEQPSRWVDRIDAEKKEKRRAKDQPPSAAPKLPQIGEVRDGYRFKGGDPSKPESCENREFCERKKGK